VKIVGLLKQSVEKLAHIIVSIIISISKIFLGDDERPSKRLSGKNGNVPP
jgi:hypothetical protein